MKTATTAETEGMAREQAKLRFTKVYGWQNCPHCRGTGIEQTGTFNTSNPICTVCNGKKILSTITGLPPL